LPLYTDRLGAFLGEGRRIEANTPSGSPSSAPIAAPVPSPAVDAPFRLPDEFLQSCRSVMQIGDRLDVLAIEIRQQSLDILLGIVRRSADSNEATNGSRNDSSRSTTPVSKPGRTLASSNNSSSRIRKRRSIDSPPPNEFIPLKEAYTTNT